MQFISDSPYAHYQCAVLKNPMTPNEIIKSYDNFGMRLSVWNRCRYRRQINALDFQSN